MPVVGADVEEVAVVEGVVVAAAAEVAVVGAVLA